MLFLLFQLGGDRYAVDVRQIEEVLPAIGLRVIPCAPRGVAGVFNYRGTTTAVIDLSALALGRPARSSISTRILIVSYAPEKGVAGLLGLLCENATETLRAEDSDFKEAGLTVEGAPYLGRVAVMPNGLVQLLTVERLLSPEVRAALFQPDHLGAGAH